MPNLTAPTQSEVQLDELEAIHSQNTISISPIEAEDRYKAPVCLNDINDCYKSTHIVDEAPLGHTETNCAADGVNHKNKFVVLETQEGYETDEQPPNSDQAKNTMQSEA